jgi:iron complex outermembrane receptor protein
MKQLFVTCVSNGLMALAWGGGVAVGFGQQVAAQPVQMGLESPFHNRDKTERMPPAVEIFGASPEYRQFDKVEITGSAILAKDAKQALPLQIIDRRDIERSGAANLPELLQRLPVMSNFSELGAVTGTVAGGPEAAAIHGNQGGTLVLLNGRRLPYYGSQTIMGERAVVDLNFLPLAAIEKIEILTDGASSRYGSDAVAGVVNVITKADVQGLSIGVEATWPQGGHGQGKGVNLSWGNGRLPRDGYSLRAHFTAQQTQAVLAKDREVSSVGPRSVWIDDRNWYRRKNHSLDSAPAENYLDAQANFGLRNVNYEKTGQCASGWYELYRHMCDRNTQGEMTLYPQTDKQLLYVQGDRVLDNRWVLFAEGLLGQQSQVTVPDGKYTPKLVTGTDGNEYLLEIVPLGLVTQKYTNQIHNLVFGLRGEQFGWDFLTSVSTGRHKVHRAYIDGLVKAEFSDLTLPSELAFQRPSQYSAETVALLKSYQQPIQVLDNGFNQMDSLNFLASREWMDTDHGPVNVGVGLDGRRERVSYASPYSEERPGFEASRLVWAAHAEVTAPLGDNSEVTAAIRHDQYSDFGGVQTGKLGWKWKPNDALLLRGSVGSGFRAPTLGQMVPLVASIDYATNPDTGSDVQVINAGNPQLKPEKSVQKSLGFRFEFGPRWSIGADIWDVNIQDTFGVLSVNQIFGNDQLKSQYLLDNVVTQNNQNLGRSIKRGIDYDVHWRQPMALGRVRTSLKGVYMLKSVTQEGASGAFVSNIGTASEPLLTTARHQWALTSLLERSQWVGGFTVHYKTGYEEQTVLTDIDGKKRDYMGRIPGHWTLDLWSRWQIQPKLSLSTHVINVTNRMPALRMAVYDNTLVGVDTRYANYMGRNLQLKLDYKF